MVRTVLSSQNLDSRPDPRREDDRLSGEVEPANIWFGGDQLTGDRRRGGATRKNKGYVHGSHKPYVKYR